MTTTTETYNGWKNYETWCVNLWLSNDEGLYNEVHDLIEAGAGQERWDIAETLKDFVEELAELTCPGVVEGASFVSDLFRAALGEVDWLEVVDAWIES